MKIKAIFYSLFIALLSAAVLSCAATIEKKPESDNQEFLNAVFKKGEDKESFRVQISSDSYAVAQTDFKDAIQRDNDPGGDQYICDEIKKYDKIDEIREGLYLVSLYPDRGSLRRVRPFKPLNLIELDNLVLEDIQRWTYKFPRKVIQPYSFYIKYRVILRKKQTDEQIIKEVQKRMRREE
jgi:hypothetical protein